MSPVNRGAAAVARRGCCWRAHEFLPDDDFRHLAQVAYDYAGIALADNKRNLVYSRVSRRLRALRMNSFGEYREFLASDGREIESFINSISTNHTKFFVKRTISNISARMSRFRSRSPAAGTSVVVCGSGRPAARAARSPTRSQSS